MRNNRSLVREVQDDYDSMMTLDLATTDESKELLVIQSIEGHVRMGHGCIKKRHSNATIEKVVQALGMDSDDIKNRRQAQIDGFFDFLSELFQGKTSQYKTPNGENLFGYHLFDKFVDIHDPVALLAGLYLGGLMDDAATRGAASSLHKIKIRQGRCCLVDLEKLAEYGLSLKDLAKNAHSWEELEELDNQGVISLDGGKLDRTHTFGFVQISCGLGTSDDLAILTAGSLFGIDAAIGVFLADAVDTWDKYVPYAYGSGQDDKIAVKIMENLSDIRRNINSSFNIPADVAVSRFISHIAKVQYKGVRSSSQRYLVQQGGNNIAPVSPIENYLDIINTGKGLNLHVGPRGHWGMRTKHAVDSLYARLNKVESGKLGRPLTADIK